MHASHRISLLVELAKKHDDTNRIAPAGVGKNGLLANAQAHDVEASTWRHTQGDCTSTNR
eukprot:8374538-Pyramimonas_sp.AAC.1